MRKRKYMIIFCILLFLFFSSTSHSISMHEEICDNKNTTNLYPPITLNPPWDIYDGDGDVSGLGAGVGSYNFSVDSNTGWSYAAAQCATIGIVSAYADFWHGATWNCEETGNYGVTFVYEFYGSFVTWTFIGFLDSITLSAWLDCSITNDETCNEGYSMFMLPNFFFPLAGTIDKTTIAVSIPSVSFEAGNIYTFKANSRTRATATSLISFPGGAISFYGTLKEILIGDDPPTKPELIGPTGGNPGESYSYSVNSTDPENDQIRYYFDWGDDSEVWTNWVKSGISVSKSHSWDSGTYILRVIAEDSYGAWSDPVEQKLYMFRNDPPETPQQPEGPTSGLIGTDYRYSTKADDPNSGEGDELYYWFDWGDGSNSGWLGPQHPIHTMRAEHNWTVSGTFELRVKVRDGHEEESDWSPSLTVEMINHPPNKPDKPYGETNGQVGEEYMYGASASDPDGHKMYYLFNFGDGTDSGWLGPFHNNSIGTIRHSWTSEGSYEVKVKAKDLFNAESEWSDPLSVSMPKTRQYINMPFLRFLEQHTHMFPLLRQLMGVQPVKYYSYSKI